MGESDKMNEQLRQTKEFSFFGVLYILLGTVVIQ